MHRILEQKERLVAAIEEVVPIASEWEEGRESDWALLPELALSSSALDCTVDGISFGLVRTPKYVNSEAHVFGIFIQTLNLQETIYKVIMLLLTLL